jgi:hypothetical protein
MDITQIIDSLKLERNRIDAAIAALNGSSFRGGSVSSGRKGRHMSAEAKARISASQKKRWAKVKAGKK